MVLHAKYEICSQTLGDDAHRTLKTFTSVFKVNNPEPSTDVIVLTLCQLLGIDNRFRSLTLLT